MDDREICKACGKELDDHFLALAPNGIAVLGVYSPDGNTKTLCYPDAVSKQDFPRCICCEEVIIEDRASHVDCTEMIISERDWFKEKYELPNDDDLKYYYVYESRHLGDRTGYSVYQKTRQGDKLKAHMLTLDEAMNHVKRINEARNR
jgi:hypothetical protein